MNIGGLSQKEQFNNSVPKRERDGQKLASHVNSIHNYSNAAYGLNMNKEFNSPAKAGGVLNQHQMDITGTDGS